MKDRDGVGESRVQGACGQDGRGDAGRGDGFLEFLVVTGVSVMDARGIAKPEQAELVMREVVRRAASSFAGRNVLIRRGYDLRNHSIVQGYRRQGLTARPFTSERIHELAVEFDLTTRRIQQILDAAKRAGKVSNPPQPGKG